MSNPEIIQPSHYDPPGDDAEEGRQVSVGLDTLAQLNDSELSRQIMTARAYPRSITGFRREMMQFVALSEEVATSCFYALKRGGKMIDGASSRFAEMAINSWGNARAFGRVVDIGDTFVTGQGIYCDLEKNVVLSYEVLRRITDKDGHRFSEDMIGVTGNAAVSIAIRNATLKGIPKALWHEAYLFARKVAVGDATTIATRRADMLKAFEPWGVEPGQIFGLLGVKGIEDVTVDHMLLMAGLRNALRDNERTPEEIFAPENMKGEVTPPRPRKSEFAREGQAGADKKPDTKPAEKVETSEKTNETASKSTPEMDTTKDKVVDNSKAATGEQASNGDAARDVFEDWYGDMKTELSSIEKVRDVGVHRTAVLSQLEAGSDKEKEFIRLCDIKTKAIMEAAKGGKK